MLNYVAARSLKACCWILVSSGQLENRKIECYRVFLTFTSLSQPSHCRLYRPINLSSGKGESSLLTKIEVFVLLYVKISQLEKEYFLFTRRSGPDPVY